MLGLSTQPTSFYSFAYTSSKMVSTLFRGRELRHWQNDAIAHWGQYHKGIIQAVPGSGKTVLAIKSFCDELEKNPKDPENIRIREEIRSLKRELNRAKQFTSIKESEILKGKESLDAISAADLMKLDKESKMRRGELLSKSFLYKRTNDIDGNIYEEPSNGSDLQA